MAEHKILSIRNVNPAWEYPTYEHLVHLDTDRVVEVDGVTSPDPEWVCRISVSTFPPSPKAPGLSGAAVLQAVDEQVAAIKHDLRIAGVIVDAADTLTVDELLKVAEKKAR